MHDRVRDAASSESIFDVDWNAVRQMIHLYVSGGGCLGQRGFSFLVVALAPTVSIIICSTASEVQASNTSKLSLHVGDDRYAITYLHHLVLLDDDGTYAVCVYHVCSQLHTINKLCSQHAMCDVKSPLRL
jgi:hypothetical protein